MLSAESCCAAGVLGDSEVVMNAMNEVMEYNYIHQTMKTVALLPCDMKIAWFSLLPVPYTCGLLSEDPIAIVDGT